MDLTELCRAIDRLERDNEALRRLLGESTAPSAPTERGFERGAPASYRTPDPSSLALRRYDELERRRARLEHEARTLRRALTARRIEWLDALRPLVPLGLVVIVPAFLAVAAHNARLFPYMAALGGLGFSIVWLGDAIDRDR